MAKNVLIIDDEKYICQVLEEYLSDQGFSVKTAFTLSEARDHLKANPLPNVIVSDVVLSDGNGFAFLKEIRASARTEKISVILMSAHRVRSQDRVDGLEGGADDYIAKPFDLKEMRLRIEKVLKHAPPILAPVKETGDLEDTLQSLLKKKPKKIELEIPVPPSAPVPTLEETVEPVEPESLPHHTILSFLRRIFDLLLDPNAFFKTWRGDKETMFVFSVIGLNAIFIGLQGGFEKSSFGTGLVQAIFFFMGASMILAWLSWSMQWIFGLKRKSLKFKSLFNLFGLALTPLALATFLGIFYVVMAHGRRGDFTAGPLLFFPSQTSSTGLGVLLRRFDLFELWGVAIISIGLKKIFKSPRLIRVWSYGIWLAAILIQASLTAFF